MTCLSSKMDADIVTNKAISLACASRVAKAVLTHTNSNK
jgi:hypothetical protein